MAGLHSVAVRLPDSHDPLEMDDPWGSRIIVQTRAAT